MPNVSKAELARNLGVSKPRVSQYIAAGLPVLASGKIDLDAGTRWIADNLRPDERYGDKGAARAIASVKSRAARQPKAEPVTTAPLNAPAGLLLEDALRPMLRAVGRIAARAAVAAGASMKVAYALDTMVSLDLHQLALTQFSPPLREALDAEDWPFEPMEPDHHEREEAFWRDLATTAGEPFDQDGCEESVNALPWSQPRH